MYKKLMIALPFVAIGVFSYIIYITSFYFSEQVEFFFSRSLYILNTHIYSFFSGLLSFSLAEVLVYIAIACIFIAILFIIASVFSKHRFYTFLKRIAILLSVVSVIFSTYVFSWGLNYARKPLADTLELTVRESSAQELYDMCLVLIDKANAFRTDVSVDEDGLYTVDKEAVKCYTKTIYKEFSPEPFCKTAEVNVKGVATKNFLSILNITGIYFPFTFEPNINMEMQDLLFAATACHEYAHFTGVAREDEANFMAYYVCRNADANFAYSGTMLAVIHSMNQLYSADYELYKDAYARLNTEIRRDLAAHSDYWANFDTKAAEIHESINNSYLQFNGQSDGVKSYGRMVDLLLALYRNGNL